MDHNGFFYVNSLLKPSEEALLEPDVAEWKHFSAQSKHQQQKEEFFNSKTELLSLQLPLNTPEKEYNASENFSSSKHHTAKRSSPQSFYHRAKNTDFLAAIPNARSSYTVKRKLNYEENLDIPKAKNNHVEKTKTYFPFEFVGHASRKSNLSTELNKATGETAPVIHPTTITGRSLRRPTMNGSSAIEAFKTQFESETPLKPRKQKGKMKEKRRLNKQVALEKHIEQIRRKHAEFNWDVNEPQKKLGQFQENLSQDYDTDSQKVPSSPFLEQYSSPSLYSLSETPLNPVLWTKASSVATRFGTVIENFDRLDQHHLRNKPRNNECWNYNEQEECSGSLPIEASNFHLYPY